MRALLLFGVVVVVGCTKPAAVAPAAAAAPPGEAAAVLPEAAAPAAARALLASGPLTVLDVRTPAEFAAGHLEGALNVDATAPDFEARLATLDAKQGYLVHCAAGAPGGRSDRAVKVLEGLGARRVVKLEGGYVAWKAAQLPVVEAPDAAAAPVPAH